MSAAHPLGVPLPVSSGDAAVAPRPLLAASGPVALGFDDQLIPEPLVPARDTLFGPRGACLLPDGALWVADTGHHRLLGWRRRPTVDNAPADFVIGQADFTREGRNGGATADHDAGVPGAATVNVPTGVCAVGHGLAVADAWNHRVLIWRVAPEADNVPADVILGQPAPDRGEPNRGGAAVRGDGFHWPYGVAWDGTWFSVSDAKNRRVLRWFGVPERDRPADLVLGQVRFDAGADNAGDEAGARGMRWPHAVAAWRWGADQGGRVGLAVADAGNNRVMVWLETPDHNGQPCDIVLGQGDFAAIDHNRGGYLPTAGSLNMPYGVDAFGGRLVVADTANSRLLAWDSPHDAAATRLAGQVDFRHKGDNGWRRVTRTSLCWPYGVSITGTTAVVADAGNNRILLWELAP